MRRFAMAVAALALMVGCAQVSGGEYRRMYGQYDTSNGAFQRLDSEGWDLFTTDQRHGSLGKAFYEDFSEYGDGDDWCMQEDLTACDSTDNALNYYTFPSGNKVLCVNEGTQSAGIDMDAGSLDISGDQTNDEGIDCAIGYGHASGGAMTVGDDPAFFSCWQLMITETDGTDDLHFGIRQIDDVPTGAWDDYTDAVSIGLITAANPGALQISTIANNGDTSETDTTETIADETRFDLCIFVSSAGVATFYRDLSSSASTSFSDLQPFATTATYTFTDAESVVPFFSIIQANADQTDGVHIYEWLWGYGAWPLTAADDGV